MELALYCPVCGYYEKEKDRVGKRGDFFTSVSVGSLFGELLAFQFSDWLGQLTPETSRVQIVEAGAHGGSLARDIVYWVRRRRPELYDRLDYVIVEPSSQRRGWQRGELGECGDHVRWVTTMRELCDPGIRGVIFANELLDAMPVHRLAWDAAAREWYEWGVMLQDERFAWSRLPQLSDGVQPPQLPGPLLDVLPGGFATEVCPAAAAWWRAAAQALREGRLLTFDYGLDAPEFFRPERSDGTLRTYARHLPGADPLSNPGDQDITADVNFTDLQGAGASEGLSTEAVLSQSAFLTRIAEHSWKSPLEVPEWNASATRQFQTLTHPEHLGRRFRVLIQRREKSP